MFSEEGVGLFGVRMHGSENLLGFCGFVRLEGMEEMELGYELTQKVWGRGLATEASRACLRYAFEKAAPAPCLGRKLLPGTTRGGPPRHPLVQAISKPTWASYASPPENDRAYQTTSSSV